jgi:hypothetical protein
VARKQAQYRSINPLHYANVQKGAPGYDAQRDRPAGGDVVSAIQEYKAILADKDKPDAERLEALRFLAHFVGDIHQPLHVGHKEDKGGNDLQVRFFDRGTNLYAVWDTGIIQRCGKEWERSRGSSMAGSPRKTRRSAPSRCNPTPGRRSRTGSSSRRCTRE